MSPVVVFMGARQTGKSTLVQLEPILQNASIWHSMTWESRNAHEEPPTTWSGALFGSFSTKYSASRTRCSRSSGGWKLICAWMPASRRL